MGHAVTVHRLSPKNQVTIPREARVFAAASKVEHFRAKRHVVRRSDSGEKFHLVLLMSEAELQARELRIMADTELSDDRKFEIVTRINDEMKMLSGALDFKKKTASDIMTPIDRVFMISVKPPPPPSLIFREGEELSVTLFDLV